MNLETKSMNFKADSLKDDGTFSGYCNVFDVKDSYGDVVKKGAFVSSLNDWQAKGKMPPILWQHDRGQVIGVWTKLYEDDHGLFGEGKLLIDDVAKAKEAYALIKNGAIDGLSIGYRTQKWAWNDDDNVLELLEIDLKEISIVTFPANTDSTVSQVKHQAITEQDIKNALAILNNINL
ncbi:HK97 family phage prohead protease [Moraxella sp. VT-16-12]|uniref:HK97 family phage prohead protease n=1 Tax=Moraxella sp. VT-16-12 TaxID=2014877 RepID=UPI000B7E7D49|nr:HK97 family phage prohead protease [Moraxella sp. VT-16-12]TWV81520.1 HK97 family phage prohead protease [Moraxella sp. VT-16-12]